MVCAWIVAEQRVSLHGTAEAQPPLHTRFSDLCAQGPLSILAAETKAPLHTIAGRAVSGGDAGPHFAICVTTGGLDMTVAGQRQAHLGRTSVKRALIASAGLLLLAGQRVHAQRIQPQFSVEGGVALATVTGDDVDNSSKNRTAPYLGVPMIVQNPSSVPGFQAGLSWVGKGAKADDAGVSGEIRLQYIEIPLMLRLAKPVSGSGVVPALMLGVAPALRISCEVGANIGGGSVSTDCADADAGVKRFDIGADLAFPAGTRLMIVPTVRFTRSLSTISDESGLDVKSSVIQIGVGLRRSR